MDDKIHQNKSGKNAATTDLQKVEKQSEVEIRQNKDGENAATRDLQKAEKQSEVEIRQNKDAEKKHSKKLPEATKNSRRPKGVGFFKRTFLPVAAVLLFRALSAVMRAKTDDKKLAKSVAEPCVILSTHGSVLDAAYAGGAIAPKYYTGVIAKKLFALPVLGKILTAADFIPKKQFVVEISCIKQIKNSIDNNISVFICPEGKTSVDGRNSYISPSIAKLIKWIGAPVLFYRVHGSYLSCPRFGKMRRGKIQVEARLLFGKDEIEKLSVDEIFEKLSGEFKYNDHEYQEKNRLKFKCRAPSKGLELLLYKCPKCGAEFKNFSKGDVISCSACGNSVKIDLYGKIIPIAPIDVGRIGINAENGESFGVNSNRSVAIDRIDRWVDFQKDALIAEIIEKHGENRDSTKALISEFSEKNAENRGMNQSSKIIEKHIENSEIFRYENYSGEVNGDGFRLMEEVVMSLEYPAPQKSPKYIKTAKGVLTLSESGIEFFPSEIFDANAKADYFYPINTLPTIAFSKKVMTLGQDNEIQAYEFAENATLYKWNFAVEILYGMNEEKNKNTH